MTLIAIIKASENGHHEVVKLLLPVPEVDPAALGNSCNSDNSFFILFSALVIASKKGHYEVVKLLLNDSRVDPSIPSNSGNFATTCSHGDRN
jgi:ankyrin repeat protein